MNVWLGVGGGVTTGLGDSATHLPENYLCMCLCVYVCSILHEWSWRSSPDRERNAGFTLQPFFALWENANDVNEKVCESPPTSRRLTGWPSSLAPCSKKGDSWATWAPKHMTSITTIQAGVKLFANRMVAAVSHFFSELPMSHNSASYAPGPGVRGVDYLVAPQEAVTTQKGLSTTEWQQERSPRISCGASACWDA